MSPVLTRHYTHIAGLALLLYDQILTWDKEVNSIWRSCDWLLKTMFCLSRYGGLAFQIINLIVTRPQILKKPGMTCHVWFHFQGCAVVALMINLQIILMLRVYALYQRSTKMACFLCCWFAFYAVVAGISAKVAVPAMVFDSDCIVVNTLHAGAVVSYSVLCIVDQCILWGLTAYKYRDGIRLGLSRNPILRLVMRDTTWVCLAVCCLLIATVPSALVKAIPFHSVTCSLLSVLTCRTILNMRGLSNPSGPLSIDVATVDIQLTDLSQGE